MNLDAVQPLMLYGKIGKLKMEPDWLKFYLKLRRFIRDGEKLQAVRDGLSELVFQRRLNALEQSMHPVGHVAALLCPTYGGYLMHNRFFYSPRRP